MKRVKIFTQSKHSDRNQLAAEFNQWMEQINAYVVGLQVEQSSDEEFHCITLQAEYRDGGPPCIMHDGKAYREMRLYSESMHRDRLLLGDRVGELPDDAVVIMKQSSDMSHHCTTIVVLLP